MHITIISALLKVKKNVGYTKNILKNRTILSLAVILSTSLVMFLLTGMLYFRNEVHINDGEDSYQVFTMLEKPEEIIAEQGLGLEKLDYYDFSGFNNETAYLSIHRTITVSVTADGNTTELETRDGDRVEDVLNRAGIKTEENDVINPELSVVCSNGDSIEIIRAIKISVIVDGDTHTVSIKKNSEETVGDVIKKAELILGTDDIVTPPLDQSVSSLFGPDDKNIVIEINRVRFIERITVTGIPYETVEIKSTLYPIGHTEIITEGVNGSEQTVTKEKLVDGKVVSDEFVSSEITNEPVNEVKCIGTSLKTPYSKREFSEIELVDGLPADYMYIVSGKSCAYTAREGSGTASGRKLQIGTIAVDPNVIPYGSLLYIVTQDGKTVYGAAVAADTGYLTDVVADLYMGTTAENYSDACEWGAKWVDIYVINTGKY